MIRLPADTELTPELILKIINADEQNRKRMERLERYYDFRHDIAKNGTANSTKESNKLVHPYGNYITDITTGYFMGEPVTYNCDEESDKSLLERLKEIREYNDEAAENLELAEFASIYGVAFEVLYMDADAQIRFALFESVGSIDIYDTTVEAPLICYIRYYYSSPLLSDSVMYAEAYDKNQIRFFRRDGDQLTQTGEPFTHKWSDVPIVPYPNNRRRLGDYEGVISLIDAYDKIDSDTVNETEQLADAYLVLEGMEDTETKDIEKAKENRVIVAPQGGKASWLVKQLNDAYIENEKKRLDEHIHKFSKCPAMTDQEFAANASGVAMKYKLLGLENVASKKEACFRKGLQRRIELICNMLRVMGHDYDYRSIKATFTRNLPSNLTESADIVNKLGGLLSQETQMSILPLNLNYDAEMKRKQTEQTSAYSVPLTEDEGDELG